MLAPARRRRSQFIATVSANVSLCREHFLLVLRIEEGFPPTEAGQFVQLSCREVTDLEPSEGLDELPARLPAELHDPDLLCARALLRRPFSLAGRRDLPDGSSELEIIHRVVGIGTDWLGHRRPGNQVGVLGPLGNRFTLPPPDGAALLVGGGVGIPPVLYLAEALSGAGLADRTVAFCGAITRDLLPLTTGDQDDVAEFNRHGIRAVLSTDDGSYGFRGFVTQALEAHLDCTSESQPRPILYTCGPELMMKRVAAIGAERGLQVQVAVERAMACGMGTCQSCCIRVRSGFDWVYKLACTDGPIFLGEQLLW